MNGSLKVMGNGFIALRTGLRDHLGVKPGDIVNYKLDENGSVILTKSPGVRKGIKVERSFRVALPSEEFIGFEFIRDSYISYEYLSQRRVRLYNFNSDQYTPMSKAEVVISEYGVLHIPKDIRILSGITIGTRLKFTYCEDGYIDIEKIEVVDESEQYGIVSKSKCISIPVMLRVVVDIIDKTDAVLEVIDGKLRLTLKKVSRGKAVDPNEYKATLTTNNNIHIPKGIKEILGIDTGDVVQYVTRNGRVYIEKL